MHWIHFSPVSFVGAFALAAGSTCFGVSVDALPSAAFDVSFTSAALSAEVGVVAPDGADGFCKAANGLAGAADGDGFAGGAVVGAAVEGAIANGFGFDGSVPATLRRAFTILRPAKTSALA
jgi:hypothetical protein